MLIVPDNVIYNGAAYTYIDSFMFFANKSIEPKILLPRSKGNSISNHFFTNP